MRPDHSLFGSAEADAGASGPPPPPGPPAEPRRLPGKKILQVAGTGALALALAAGGFQLGRDTDRGRSAVATVDLSSDVEPIAHSSTSRLVEAAMPSVVSIEATSVGFDPINGSSERTGQGSGVVIDESGVILTNNHVVSGAVEVRVVFNDDVHEPMEATVLGTDPQHDLAIVRVDADDLEAIALGSSDDLKLGDKVVAIGFPLGLGGPTVTEGIVSGLDRTISPRSGSTVQELTGMLQTDAAINPGNSGGALLDAAGRLVGINTAAAGAGAAENIGFAIPIDEAAPVAEEIVNDPPSERAWLGVQVASVTTSAEAAQLGLPLGTRGASIQGLIPGGGAEASALEVADVIVGIDDQIVTSGPDLTRALADLSPGDVVDVRVITAAGERTVEVELKARPPTM